MMREVASKAFEEQKKESWRSMIQSTGSALLWLLILLVLGGLYLSVSAKAASAGRTYLTLEEQVEDAERKHSDLVAQLADVTSPQRMMELAQSMGFRPATRRDVRYVLTDETPRTMDFQAPPPKASLNTRLLAVSPAYTETLVEAIHRWFGIGGEE
jgi:cell division protein FtsL